MKRKFLNRRSIVKDSYFLHPLTNFSVISKFKARICRGDLVCSVAEC